MKRKKHNLKEKKERDVERKGNLKNILEILNFTPFQKPRTIRFLFLYNKKTCKIIICRQYTLSDIYALF